MKTLNQILREAQGAFQAAGFSTPELDARLLLQRATGLNREKLFLELQREVSPSEESRLSELVSRRLGYEPVSRILGRREFWKSSFKISKETLDPRADSEALVEAVLQYADKAQDLRLLDLGTGTGCLLLSLLQELPLASGTGIDISADAVRTAEENARVLELDNRAAFQTCGWQDFVPDCAYDIVIGNPPYISDMEMRVLSPEVILHDPFRALYGGEDGLVAYREITGLLPRFLVSGGIAAFEIGHRQAADVGKLLADAGLTVLETVPDLAGNDRVVVAKMP